jgi:hypothetical protein
LRNIKYILFSSSKWTSIEWSFQSHWVLTPLPYFIIHSSKFHFVLSDEAIGPHCKHFFVLLLFKRYSEWKEITTSCEDFNLELSWFFDVVLQILIDSLLQLLQTWIRRHARPHFLPMSEVHRCFIWFDIFQNANCNSLNLASFFYFLVQVATWFWCHDEWSQS